MSPLGAEIKNIILKPNAFGTLAFDFALDKNTTLGTYSVQVMPEDDTKMIENAYTSFQVEVFKNPPFTADVKLRSPDIENNLLLTLRKKPNTDTGNPWYENVYTTDFSLDGIVTAKYYNGSQMR